MRSDSQVHGANKGPTWGRQDQSGPHVGPINLGVWACLHSFLTYIYQGIYCISSTDKQN